MENEKTKTPNDTPSNKSNDSDFDIESLDPDKRTWYYDGDGTKRKKE